MRTDVVGPVVHVISDAGPHPYFRTLIEAGGVDRESVIVGCVGPPGPLQRDMAALGVRTFALGSRDRSGYPLATLRLARILRRIGARVVQTHLVDGSLVGLSAARLAGTPVRVFTAHHSHELPFHGRKLTWLDRLCATRLCNHVIAPSRQVAETLASYTGIDIRKVAVVHHGFDLEALNPDHLSGAGVRDELGLDGKLVFGAIGRLYRLKNYGALIEAFAETCCEIPEACLLIVGPGDATELRQLTGELGVGERVIFTGARHDIPAVLAAIDAFVHPALAESFGMVIIEAMAMGKPIVSTPVGISREVIEGAVTGVLCDGCDRAALAAGLTRLLSVRSRWPQLGATARARVANFTATTMARSYVTLYANWLADGANRS